MPMPLMGAPKVLIANLSLSIVEEKLLQAFLHDLIIWLVGWVVSKVLIRFLLFF